MLLLLLLLQLSADKKVFLLPVPQHLLLSWVRSSLLFVRSQIKHKLSALSGLKSKLEEMQTYLKNVLDGKLPVNNQV